MIRVERAPTEFTYRWILDVIERSHRSVWDYRQRSTDLPPSLRPDQALRLAAGEADEARDTVLQGNGNGESAAAHGPAYKDALADCAILLLTAWGPRTNPTVDDLPVPTAQDLIRLSHRLGDTSGGFVAPACYLAGLVAGGADASAGSDPFYRTNHIIPALGVILCELGRALPKRVAERLSHVPGQP